MTLNRDDYPDLTDEQWTALESEFDRARTQASKTAKANAEKDLRKTFDAEKRQSIEEAIEEQRKQLEMTEHEKLEAERKKLDVLKGELAADRKSLTARKTLTDAGLPEDKIEALVPMFVAVDDQALNTTLDTFVKTYQDGIAAAVDTQKQELLTGATPPSSSGGGNVDVLTQSQKLAEAGDGVGAIDALLTAAAGSIPTQ